MNENIDFLSGSDLAIENARRLASCADTISKSGEFGPANSLLILSIEECVKAFFLFAFSISGSGAHAPAHDLIKVLTVHKYKHYFGFVTQAIIDASNTMANDEDLSSRIEKDFAGIDELDRDTVLERLTKVISESASKMMNDLEQSIFDNEKIYDREWWSGANTARNRGFYTDYESDGWVTPKRVGGTEYEKTRDIAQKLTSAIDGYRTQNTQGVLAMRQIISAVSERLKNREMVLPDKL